MSYFAVTKEKIATIEPIQGADRIVKATLEGIDFSFVVGKGQFEIGETILYIPVDAIIPITLQEKLNLVGKLSGGAKNRVKTVKLKNTYSMGLACKLSLIDDLVKTNQNPSPEEITKFLGIEKYDHEEQNNHGPKPDFVDAPKSKFKKFLMSCLCRWLGSEKGKSIYRSIFGYAPGTLIPLHTIGLKVYDLESAQRYKSVVEKIMDKKVTNFLKCEGRNARIIYKPKKKLFGLFGKDYEIIVCQRRFIVTKDPNIDLFKIIAKQKLEDFVKHLFSKYNEEVAVYFEACGSENGSGSISGNIYKFNEYIGFIFDIKIGDKFMNAPQMIKEINEFYGDEKYMAPTVCRSVTLREFLNGRTIEEAAEIKDILNHNGSKLEEGIVIKMDEEEYSPELQDRLVLKFRSKAYLAQHDT